MNDLDRLDRDRIGILTGALLLALALGRFLAVVTQPFRVPWLNLAVDGGWLLAFVVIGLSVSGTAALVRHHPRHHEQAINNIAMHMLLPTALAIGLMLNLGALADLEEWLAALVAAGILIALALALEYQSISPRARSAAGWQWGMLAIHHLAILLLYLAIEAWPTAALVQGVTAFVATWLLVARLFWASKSDLADAFMYGGVAGVIMAQAAWAITIWPLTQWRAALLLLVVFYVVVGLLVQQRQQRVTRRVVLEHCIVALLAVAILGLLPG